MFYGISMPLPVVIVRGEINIKQQPKSPRIAFVDIATINNPV